MALIKCKKCGHDVNSQIGTKCPNCGKQVEMKWYQWIILTLAIIIILFLYSWIR